MTFWSRLRCALARRIAPTTPAPPAEAPPPATLRPYDVFLFPVIDYEYRFQRPQHFSMELARRGHRVFYFATEFTEQGCNFDLVPRLIDPSIYLVTLPAGENPPNIYRDVPNECQLHHLETGILRIKKQFKVGATLSLVNYPFWYPLVKRLNNNIVCYDCMDDYSSFTNAGAPVRELEPTLVRDADLIVCSSGHLQELVRQKGRESTLIRNGVDPDHFETPPPNLALEPGLPTVGYYGAINVRIDVGLIAFAARALPEARFVLVGEVEDVDVSQLRALPNVTLIGEVPYPDLPKYVHAFDVCLIPYRICGYSLASNPVKTWEYLSAGKPVVSVRYPELEDLEGCIRLARDREEFVQAIRAELSGDDARKGRERQALARSNTWSCRCDVLQAEAARFFPKVSVIVLCHNQVDFTKASLASVADFSDYPNLEVVLVDNGSTDGSAEFLSEWAAQRAYARVVLMSTNAGFSAGNNAGVRAASGDYFVLLNNDVFVTQGWIGDLLAHFRADPKLGLVGPVTNRSGNESVIPIHYEDMEQMAYRARNYTRDHRGQRTRLDAIHFFCVMIPRRVWEQVGELDEGFGLGLFEDDDYCMRVRQAGYEIACAEDVFVHHHPSATFGAFEPTAYRDLFERNRRYFESKWGPWRPPTHRPGVQVD